MLKLRSKIIVFLVLPLICWQCNIFSKKKLDVELKRFDVDFYATDTADFKSSIENLIASYPKFFPVFVEQILPISDNYKDVDSYLPALYQFRTHPSMLGLKDSIQVYYPNVQHLEKQFSDAFSNYATAFPDAKIPEVVTFISEFGHKAILYPDGLGVSLDMFLGKQYPFYKGIGLPNYIIDHLNKDQILPNAMRVLSEDYVVDVKADATLLDRMILEGKRLYFAQQMLPKTPKHKIIEYTKEDYDWCKENEFGIWSFFIENEWLYNSKYTEYKRYIEDAPNVVGMPLETPGKVAVWTGWQIVNAYMSNNRSVRLADLMKIEDAQLILNESKYKPKP